MWIVPWNPFLMKKLLKSEVYGSCKQCTGPTGVHCPPLILLSEQCTDKKVKNHGLKKKCRHKTRCFSAIQTNVINFVPFWSKFLVLMCNLERYYHPFHLKSNSGMFLPFRSILANFYWCTISTILFALNYKFIFKFKFYSSQVSFKYNLSFQIKF